MSTNIAERYSLDVHALPAPPLTTSSVAIIGAGRVGTALARGFVAAGYDVRLAGSGEGSVIELIAQVVTPGARAMNARDAIDGADLVVLAVPLGKVHTVDPSLLDGHIVIDVANYWAPIDGDLPEFAQALRGTSPLVAARFPGARLVKSFNHLGYHDLDQDRRESGDPGRRAIAVASDDAEAAATVMVAIDALGFDAVYAGTLERGVALEAGGAVFGRWLNRDDLAAELHG